MKHRVTGSIDLNTEGIAEAVYDRLAPVLKALSAPAPASPLEPEQSRVVLAGIVGFMPEYRTNPYSDREIATALVNALLAAGYTLAPIPGVPDETDGPAEKYHGFWGEHA